jgi:hypothetical protein
MIIRKHLGRRVTSAAIAVLAVAAALVVSTAASAAPAVLERPPFAGAPRLPAATTSARLCTGHAPEYGSWVNADPATRSITSAQLADCVSVTTCSGDVCSIAYDSGWAMRLFGACHPTACDWGWSAGQARLSSGRIPAYYDQGFAKRSVVAAMSAYRPGQLWIAISTDFVDPNRADYQSQDWFVRA